MEIARCGKRRFPLTMSHFRAESFDFVFLGAAELVLAGLSATFGQCPLAFWAVLDTHDQSSRLTFKENDILVAASHLDENPK